MKIIQLEKNDTESVTQALKILEKNGFKCSIEEMKNLAEMDKLIAEKNLEFQIHQLEQQITELDNLHQQLTMRVRGFVKMDIPTCKMSIVDKFLAELSGYTVDEWINTPNFIQTIVHPDFENYYSSCCDKMKKGIVPKIMEYKIIRENGEERWWLQFNIGAFDIKGKLVSISSVILDNTEHKETEIKYRNLFENLNAGIFRVNIETGEFLEVNQRLANAAGYPSVEEFKEKCNAVNFYYDIEDRNKIIEILKTQGKVTDFEVKLKNYDGKYFWVSHSASYYPKEGFCEGIIIDVTNRKKAEEKLKESEERFRSLVEQSVAGIIIIKNDKIIFANDIIFKHSGYSSSQFTSMELDQLYQIIYPEDREFVMEQFKKVDETGMVPEFYFRIITKENKTIWLSTQLKKFTYEDGTAISCVIVEVTKRIELEQKLTQEHKLAQSYFDIAGVLLVVLNRDANVIKINKFGCEILGYTQEEIIGKNWIQNFLPNRIQSAVQRTFNRCINGEISPDDYFENYILTKNGEERLILWHNAVLKDAEGNIIEIISSGEDITIPHLVEAIKGDNEIVDPILKENKSIN
ncbi:MAG TPA: PAS domain S-box protein [Candidatus Bathyarchaeia archaeon]|nr:PAS domain S-box protein [Candidatus Bathyarchaeia archaeon]